MTYFLVIIVLLTGQVKENYEHGNAYYEITEVKARNLATCEYKAKLTAYRLQNKHHVPVLGFCIEGQKI